MHMRIIISPAKQMRQLDDGLPPETQPVFLDQAQILLDWLRGLTYDQAKRLWACNDRLATENYERLAWTDLQRNLTPAILAYDGIAFKYMAPSVFEGGQFAYVQDRLRILSGFYGCLRPMDGVVPYRLEMQAKAQVNGAKDLYAYWGAAIYDEVMRENADRVVVNLASKEYSKCVERYVQLSDTFVTCVFAEDVNGKPVQKGVYCKMARGEMVRFMAERNVQDVRELQGFSALGYAFDSERSTEDNYLFIRA